MKKILYFLLPLLLMTACHKNSYVARVTDVRLVSVDPKNGYPGDLVTLLGNNFSTDPEKNIVMLGGERARVLEAYSNRLLPTMSPANTSSRWKPLPARPRVSSSIT